MAMKMVVFIRGLALCYIKDNFWNIVFVCDDVHPLKFTRLGSGTPPATLHENGKNQIINFNIGRTPETAPGKGRDFGSIFNMAADYAHGRKQLVETASAGGRTNAAVMQIPNADLDSYMLTDRDYFVQLYESSGSQVVGDPVEVIGRVSHIVTAIFDVTDAVEISVKDKESNAEIQHFSFPYADGTTVFLDFDNDCYDKCQWNDFVDLYEWVSDKTGKKFVAGQIKSQLINGTRQVFSFKEDQHKESEKNVGIQGFMFNALQGNCDPVKIDPPPDPPGRKSRVVRK